MVRKRGESQEKDKKMAKYQETTRTPKRDQTHVELETRLQTQCLCFPLPKFPNITVAPKFSNIKATPKLPNIKVTPKFPNTSHPQIPEH